jgi:ribosomal protein S13
VEIDFTFDSLSKYFHLPINKVIDKFGVGETCFKRVCRSLGMATWPYRKISTKAITSEEVRQKLIKDITHLQVEKEMQMSYYEAVETEEFNECYTGHIESRCLTFAEMCKANPDSFLLHPRQDDAMDQESIQDGRSETSDESSPSVEVPMPCDNGPTGDDYGYAAQFLLNFPAQEGGWGDACQESDIPSAAALHPLVDPFHDDWFMNQAARPGGLVAGQ